MRTASMVLGIVGGVLAVIFAIVFIIGGAFVSNVGSALDSLANELENQGWEVEDNGVSGMVDATAGAVGFGLWGVGILSIIGAVLAFIGAAKVKKSNVVAGVLMLVASVPSFFTGLGVIASILLIIGGILALVPESKQNVQAA